MKLMWMILMVAGLTNIHDAGAKDRGKILELPEKVDQWELSSVEYYNPGNLWDYIDGGAELFLSYGFSGVQAMTYKAEGQPEIIVDVFDMNTSEDAYGVFSYSRHNSDDRFGQDSQYSRGFLIFWMDHYYISIIAHPETEESAKALEEIAHTIEEKIGDKGSLPAILGFLPSEDLVESSVKYFHHYVWLNSLHFISHDNILNIRENTPAALAVYQAEEEKAILLLVCYGDEDSASLAGKNFTEKYLEGKEDKPVYLDEKSNWAGIRKVAQQLVIVINGSSYGYTLDILNKAEETILKKGL